MIPRRGATLSQTACFPSDIITLGDDTGLAEMSMGGQGVDSRITCIRYLQATKASKKKKSKIKKLATNVIHV